MGKKPGDNPKKKITPESYIKLAKISIGIQEFQLAATSCDKGLERFSNHVGLLIAKGETLVSAYNFEKKPGHLKTAMESFEAALKINPHNYVGKFLTGQIYLQLKNYPMAIKRFASILEIDPTDTRAKSLLEKAKARLEGSQGASIPDATKEQKKNTGKKTIESCDANDPASPGDKKDVLWETGNDSEVANLELLSVHLGIFNKIEGLKSIYLIDDKGNILKSQKRSDLNPELFCSMVGNIDRATNRVFDKFNIGDYVYSMVMTQTSLIYSVNVKWAFLIIETSPDTNQELTEKKIYQYIETLKL